MRRRNQNDAAVMTPAEPGAIQTTGDLVTRNIWEPYFRFLLFLTGIWRNWYWIFPLAMILAVGTAAALYLFLPYTYTSSAWIRIAARKPYSVFNDPGESRDNYLFFVKTNLAFLSSPDVLEPAFHEITVQAKEKGLDLAKIIPDKDPMTWLVENMSVAPREQSEIYLISFTTESQEGSAILANAVTSSYLRYLDTYDLKNRLQFTNTVMANIDIYKKRIEGLKKELSLLAESITNSGGVYPVELANTMQSDPFLMEAIRSEAMLEMLKQEKLQNEGLLDPKKEINLDDSVVESFVDIDPNMMELIKDQMTQKMKLDNLKEKLEDQEAPEIRQATRRLEEIESKMEKLRKDLLVEKKQSWVYEMKTKAKQDILRLEQEIESQEKSHKRYKEKYDDRLAAMSKGNQDILKATFKQGEIAREEIITDLLLDRLNQMNVEKDTPGRITSIQTATPARKANTKTRFRMIGMSAFLVFCVPFCLGWARELLSERYYHTQQFRIIYPGTSVRYIAGMPNSGLSTTVSPRNRRQVQRNIEELCNELISGKYFRKSRTLVLTIVEKDDNQSLFTASIAKTLAKMTGKPILLLNANFRNERLERILKLDPDAEGLPGVLQLKCALSDALVRDQELPNLYYLPGGETDDSPINLFADGNFELLLEELEKHYSMVIISAPPLYTSSETYVLAGYADTLIVCARLRDTRRVSTQQVCKKLSDIDSLPKGFVIS